MVVDELNESLEKLRKVAHELHLQSLQTRDAMGRLVNDSNLRSTLTLLKEYIGFKRLIYSQV